MTRIFQNILKFVIVSALAAGLIVYNLATISATIALPVTLIKSYLGSGIYEVGPDPQDLTLSFMPDQTLHPNRVAELRAMLLDGDLERLNAALADYQGDVEDDFFNEYKVYDAYRAFEATIAAHETSLTNWQKAFPESYQPHLALAKYYYAKGWEARGHKFITDTPQDKIDSMRHFLALAEEHLNNALAIHPRLIVGYNLLICIQNTLGNDDAEDQLIEDATALFPHSFLIRSTAAWAKTPRWGGDYQTLEGIASAAQAYVDTNPKLSALYGFVYYDQARRFRRQKNYAKAEALFTKAIAYGDHWLFYNGRAKLYHFDLGDTEAARADIDRSLELRPTLGASHRLRSRIAFAGGQYDAAHDSLKMAERLVPEDPDTQKWRVWASGAAMKIGHQSFKTDILAAVDMYNHALLFDAENFEAYYWRGVARYQDQDPDAALADLESAIGLNPHHFESYQMIDRILAGNRQWDRIVDYWNRFIALEPDHADAYLELAGTHRHNQDHDQSRRYLQKACGLGSQKACGILTRMGVASS